MKPIKILICILTILICISCNDDCKEAKCNPHPEGEIIVNDKCECSCRHENNLVYSFNGQDICFSPEKENEMKFIRANLPIDSVECSENELFIVGLTIFDNRENSNEFEYRIGSIPSYVRGSGNLIYNSLQNEYTFDGGLGHGDNFIWPGNICVPITIYFRAVGHMTEDKRQFHMEMTTFSGENLEDVLNNENPLATYDIIFDRLEF